jgi:hypothetical protein
MITSRNEFISRFLYRIGDDEFYGNAGTLPEPEVIARATGAAEDIVGFETHRESFSLLAEMIDVCTAEEIASRGSGVAARNASKHPLVTALKKLDLAKRASIACAASQGLAWMEDCREWVQDHTLRNQIAKRVMLAVLVSVGRNKKGYTAAQLAALARIRSSLEDMDIFVVRAREVIDEIVCNEAAA